MGDSTYEILFTNEKLQEYIFLKYTKEKTFPAELRLRLIMPIHSDKVRAFFRIHCKQDSLRWRERMIFITIEFYGMVTSVVNLL